MVAASRQPRMPWTIAALLLSLSTVAGAEGSHENGAVVRYMHILSEVQTRFATTDIVSEIENTGKEAVEVVYLAELPENAFIRSFYLQRNGNVTFGEIKAKEQAQIEFDDAKKGGRTAAHIRQTNDKTFELRISLKESEKIGFNMTYQEVLHKQSYMYKHVINIKPNLPVLDLEVNVLIADKHNFSKIHVPTFEDGIGSLPVAELLKKPQDERVIMQTADDDSGSIAYLSFEPRVKMHDGQLVVLFNNTENPGTTELQIVDGYFLHQYSPPEDLPVGNKTVVFILDKSGSMLGNKLDQMKEAMNEILDEIADGDRVNLIAFDKDIEKWRDDVTTLDAESKDEAKKWIAGLEARGGTNIDEALHEGLKMLAASEQAHPSFMPSVMVLSDGRPTVGLKEHEEILANLNTAGWNYSVNSISFGNDADYLLMKKIGGRNHPGGIARRIFENADATIQIAGFYNEIALPLLKHIHITYLDEDVEVSSVITSGEQDFFFAGDDFFQLGRFSDPSAVASAVHADLETEDSNGIQESKTEVVPSTACIDPSLVDAANENKAEWAKSKSIAVCGKKDASIGNFIERMWAHLTVVKLEKTLVANTKTDEEKRNVAVRIGNLSVRYGFVSTQTSMVVVLEDNSQALTLEEREFETKILEKSSSSSGLGLGISPQGADLSSAFRTPFVASRQDFPDECKIHLVVLVDRVFRRRISALRTARMISDLSLSLPEYVTMTIGDISSNRSIIILGGTEEKLFFLVSENKEVRQQLVVVSEMAAPLDRPLVFLRLLSPAFTRIVIAKTAESITTSERIKLETLGKIVIPKNPDALSISKNINCNL